MRGHTAADSQDTLSRLHAGDVLGRGLKTNENDLLALFVPCLSVLSGEHDLAAGSAGRCAQTLADRSGSLESGGIELGMEQGVEVSGVDHRNSLFLGSHALVNEVTSNLEGSLSGSLAVSGLQHVELAVLNGELHVLHISVVVFEGRANLLELLERLGEFLCHLRDGHRSTNACNNVLALCVGQELAHELLFAGGGVTGERNAGAAVVAHVAECHGLYVNGSTPGIGNVVVAAVNVCSGVVPGTEYCHHGAHQLLLGIIREVSADLLFVFSLELVSQLLEVFGVEVNVLGDALLFLHLVDELFKIFLADFHNYIGIHLNESSVAVPSEYI